MKTEAQIREALQAAEEVREVRLKYAATCSRVKDWHGVMDAAADIREVEAELAALRWVLE